MELTAKKNSSRSSDLLAPGFRFHPTDEELVRYYLRRKICGKGFRFDAISDVDVYKFEPWDLPCMSKLKTRDLEWYFFSMLDKKYGNGARTNRATEKGYWKTTGKDRAVYHRTQIVGMKKTLVYHCGRAPKGQRTNWVMHEYRHADLELEKAGIAQDAVVLCRIFQKSGAGPKNGEQYGAPFVEEEWDFDDESELVSKEEASGKDAFHEDACLDANDLLQIFGPDVPLDVAAPFNFQSSDGSCDEATTESFNDTQKLAEPNQWDDNNVLNLPAQYEIDSVEPAKNECYGENNNSGNFDYLDYILSQSQFVDSYDYLPPADDGFIESNDLSNSFETDNPVSDMLNEYLYFDANDSKFNDPAMMLGSEDLVQDQTYILQEELNQETKQSTLLSEQFIDNYSNDEKVSDKQETNNDQQETSKGQSGSQYQFVKRASQMLGKIPAPDAFAAEFPSKDAIVRLNSAHVTAGVIQIKNLNMGGGNGTDQSSSKHENFNIVLSFGFARGNDGSASLESSVNVFPGRNVSSISRSLFYLFFWGVLILSMTFKLGTYVCAN